MGKKNSREILGDEKRVTRDTVVREIFSVNINWFTVLGLKCLRFLKRDIQDSKLSATEAYRRHFIKLFNNENVNRICQEIESLLIAKVIQELTTQHYSIKVSEKIFRERLLWLQTRLILGEVVSVLWTEKYDAEHSEYVFVSEGTAPRLENIPEEELSASMSEYSQVQSEVGAVAGAEQSDEWMLLFQDQEKLEAASTNHQTAIFITTMQADRIFITSNTDLEPVDIHYRSKFRGLKWKNDNQWIKKINNTNYKF